MLVAMGVAECTWNDVLVAIDVCTLSVLGVMYW